MLTFRRIASKYDENINYEPHNYYTNGVHLYFKGQHKGYVTVLDMNSAYLYALSQPLADWETKTEVNIKDVFINDYDYYLVENDIHRKMFYKNDIEGITSTFLWKDSKIYGFKSKLYYQNTIKELFELRKKDKTRYKNVANVAIGCMHKRSGKRNNTTLASSLYAWFEWYINDLVKKFENKGYNVIMITTDSIKISGKYDLNDNIVKIGEGLGEFKIEYEGEAEYINSGHYTEKKVKWKGVPEYMRNGASRLMFIDNIEEEYKVYEKYAVTRLQKSSR